jgi:hypothetical protein
MLSKYMRIFFLVAFTLLSSGAVATLHMCQDQVKGMEWFSGESKKCPCNKKDMKDGCCDTLLIQFEQDDATPTVTPAIPSDAPVGVVEAPKNFRLELKHKPVSSMGVQAMELVPIVPLWLSNHSLRIPEAC